MELQYAEERRIRREELRAEVNRRKERIAAGLELEDSDDDNDDNDDDDEVLGDHSETRRQRRARRRQTLAELEEEDKGPMDELGRERVKLGVGLCMDACMLTPERVKLTRGYRTSMLFDGNERRYAHEAGAQPRWLRVLVAMNTLTSLWT